MATDPAYFAVALKPIAVVFVSCANDCAPYAVAPVATTVRVAPLTPISVPAPAQVPVAVESTPLATEQPAALETVCTTVLSKPRPCVTMLPVPPAPPAILATTVAPLGVATF